MAEHTTICRFCLTSGKFVNAHVIPKAFYDIGPQHEGSMQILTSREGDHPRRSRIGVYDSGILCDRCEPTFDKPDSYAAKLLLQSEATFRRVLNDGQLFGYQVDSYDYATLKLFFMGVLWRAAVSSHDLFKDVQIGRYEQQLRTMLMSGDPGTPDDFAVTLSLYDERPAAGIILNPMRARLGNVNAYQFEMDRYTADIKVDRQRLPDYLRARQLSDAAPLRILHGQFSGSEKQRIASMVMKQNEARRGGPVFPE